jgi:hypothetical protein
LMLFQQEDGCLPQSMNAFDAKTVVSWRVCVYVCMCVCVCVCVCMSVCVICECVIVATKHECIRRKA